jgi:hypothetical protein
MNRDFFTSPTGQVVLVAAVLALGIVAVRWQQAKRNPAPLPAAASAPAAVLPKTHNRDGARFKVPPPAPAVPPIASPVTATPASAPVAENPIALPLALFAAQPAKAAAPPRAPFAPYGRLIPCETVVALESNRLETPVVGLVTEDVWHDGRRVIPAGAEVHARAALDRTRERLAVAGPWRIVWRTPDAENGLELAVDGLALDREFSSATGRWGAEDGSAGLRGQLVKVSDERELKLFAATFLASATGALQDTRLTSGLLGEASVPVASARNAVLAGTGAVLRDYAQAIREAIARDGFYLRVPAGKPFYLYVTQTLDLAQAQRPAAASVP